MELINVQNNWNDEKNSAALYHALSAVEKDKRIAEVYTRMALVELRHAEKWEQLLTEAGKEVPKFKPSLRTRLLIGLSRKLGPGAVLPGLQAMEKKGSSTYQDQIEAKDMLPDERSHSLILSQISQNTTGGMLGSALAQLEGRHRSAGGNALRAAVLGANDGLVSNLSLVMGVAGASMSNQAILITGFAGLLAGSCSMALGEWLSVQSSRELHSHQIKIESDEIIASPEDEAEELALIYEARGLTKENAQFLANQIMSNKEKALDTLVRDELGIDPQELGGSAWEAAITSFLLFAAGAIIPVIPFNFLSGLPAIITSISFSIVGLFLIGATITLFTGKPLFYSGMRMVIFGLIAALITFGIGLLIGGGISR